MNLFWAETAGVPGTDRGVAYGDGLFETIRMQGTGGVLLSAHIARMLAGAETLGIPLDETGLRDVIGQACLRYGNSRATAGWVLKLVLTRGAGGRGYRPTADLTPNMLVSAAALPPLPDKEGVAVATADFPLTVNPRLAGIKTLNRLEQVMASRELTDDLFEVIMASPAGEWIEGTRTNLLVRTADAWLTPPVSQLAVAGVMRDHVVRALEQQGARVVQRGIVAADLEPAQCLGLYLINSLSGVVPVRKLDGQDLPVDGALATIFNPLDLVEFQV